ncbi:glycosyltransferase [Bowmanella dokdonensis]|uniref:Glycosyltransferase n=1 Tax=Bowmanella dokdonensis TaxID=751969 RepID=A0A939DMW6_9ALTE|nr:glycosyltransferase [Bowmanella dokdonensis]MBN7824696.1 glycosyltransferase [Bowmanella dokdonensis]
MANIMIILHDLRGGGAEKMMVRLANQLALGEDQVELVLLSSGGDNLGFVSERVQVSELGIPRTLKAFMPLRRHLKHRAPDAILSVLTHVNVVAALACASLGWLSRLSVSERNTFSLDRQVNRSLLMKATYGLAPLLYRLLPRPVIAVSRGVAQDLIAHTLVRADNVTCAPNPVIAEETREAASASATHPWLREKPGKVLVAVGRLSHQKGFDLLIEAFARVCQSLDCYLIIFGEGELRAKLTKQAAILEVAERLDMPGYTANPIAEVQQADLFVLSSRFEGSPNGLVEAMSVGTPVVAFDCPHGPREILRDGTVAPLVRDGDVKALAEAIVLRLSHDPDRQTRLRLTEAVQPYRADNAALCYRQLLLGKPA